LARLGHGLERNLIGGERERDTEGAGQDDGEGQPFNGVRI
jgi:hypothetical protein